MKNEIVIFDTQKCFISPDPEDTETDVTVPSNRSVTTDATDSEMVDMDKTAEQPDPSNNASSPLATSLPEFSDQNHHSDSSASSRSSKDVFMDAQEEISNDATNKLASKPDDSGIDFEKSLEASPSDAGKSEENTSDGATGNNIAMETGVR